ncbi:MAG TPA: HAD-IIIC family phosphatase [Bryobacteraceae bacterium]|jgi:FkbH-like protein|nr:HAD-IIIC family phosphatase [Bryobacteraceae bacterium]
MLIQNLPVEQLLQKYKQIRRELLPQALVPLRIAVLGGVTTNEVVNLLELLLMADGFQPLFYQSEYNRYYEDAVLEPEKIRDFRPNIVYIHTHWINIEQYPSLGCSEKEFQLRLQSEMTRFSSIWESVQERVGCQIIQNNFEHPPLPILGCLDSVSWGGKTRFVYDLNLEFSKAAQAHPKLLIQDLNGLAASIGHAQWHDWSRWYSYKILTTPEASLLIAKSLAAMIGAMLGRAKKCLVLDLDNTLWGGLIGDDGIEKIQIGRETGVAEAYSAFQEYCLSLRERGIILAACSKNDLETAKSGFQHPDSVLKLEHFASFKANWEPKHENIKAIAEELGLGLDSFVFVDDNPAERAIVAAQLPMVTVPDMGSEVAFFPSILQASRCFETVALSKEDFERAESYSANAIRSAIASKFANYGEYLQSLHMSAEIDSFPPIYIDRITQLINKTNQFNLTTRRYTLAEIEDIAKSRDYITLYGRLADSFGDNGLISVIIGRREHATLSIDLWIMSCRVLKRDMELAMLDALVERAKGADIERIVGYYRRTAKNAMVETHYGKLGFTLEAEADAGVSSVWSLSVPLYSAQNKYIQTRTLVHG